MRFAKFCYTELNMGICIKTIIVLSSYFGILQSASEQQTGNKQRALILTVKYATVYVGVYLRLKGRTNFTDSLIPIHEIGITTNEITHPNIDEAENNGLQCVTDKPNCCRVGSRIRIGEWYFPDGTRVPILDHGSNRATSFFRNRGNNDSTVNLNRVSSDVASPTGQFCCRVPDSMDRNQTVCVNISEPLNIILV